MEFTGNYILNIKFGDTTVPLSHQMIQELTITQDMDRFLPTFKLVVKDATGLMGEILPFDKNQNKVSIEIARSDNPEDLNEFKFTVGRRETSFDRSYSIQGILDVDNLVEARKIRALTGNIKSNLETLAEDELGIDAENMEVGASLNYSKTILQPNWNNAKLLDYVRENIAGKNNEAGYFCFIKNVKGKKIFVFRSISELSSDPSKYNLMVSHEVHKDFFPILDYKVFDSSKLIIHLGAKYQDYAYFDYTAGSYKIERATIDDYLSLAGCHLIDDDESQDGVILRRLGRSNSFTSDFKGRVKTSFYGRVSELISMWAATWGLQNISPGDIVKVIFGEAFARGDLFLYQHSGFWMVKRVVHILSSSFLTNLLLVRSGIDTDIETTLAKAQYYKKR